MRSIEVEEGEAGVGYSKSLVLGERQLCLPAAQSQEGLLVLSMCGPKKQVLGLKP